MSTLPNWPNWFCISDMLLKWLDLTRSPDKWKKRICEIAIFAKLSCFPLRFIALSCFLPLVIVLSCCRLRIIVLSASYYHVFAFALSYYRVFALAFSYFRLRVVAHKTRGYKLAAIGHHRWEMWWSDLNTNPFHV